MQHTRKLKTDSYAAHEALLTFFLLSCSIVINTHVQYMKIAHVQYIKVDSHAAYFMSHAFFDLSHDKIEEHTHVHCMRVST